MTFSIFHVTLHSPQWQRHAAFAVLQTTCSLQPDVTPARPMQHCSGLLLLLKHVSFCVLDNINIMLCRGEIRKMHGMQVGCLTVL